MSNDIKLDFYLVRNKEGKWFRAKGYGGSGDSWTEDVKKARVYGRIGPARSIVTYFTSTWPDYGVPEIVHFEAGIVEVMNETERVKKSQQAKALYQMKHEESQAKHRLEAAEKQFKAAQEQLIKAKKWRSP
jgi:hypothetical protein